MQIRKVVRNAGASLIMQVVNIIANIILPPMIIGVYGSKINGLVSSIKQLMSYVSLVGAGISVSTTQSLYKPLAQKDYKTISGMLNAANNMFSKAGSFFGIIALALSFVYPIFLRDDIAYFSVVILIIVMSIAGASEFFVVGKCRALLYADQKAYVSAIVDTLGLALSFIFAFLCIKLRLNIVLVQLSYSLIYFIRIFVLTYYINNTYTYLDPKEKPIEEAVKKKNDAFLHQLTGLVTLSSQAIILTMFVGLEAASIFSIYNVIFSGLQSICNHIVNAVAPFLGRIKALNKEEELKIKFDKVEFVYNIVITFVYSVCSVMLMSFISLYVGENSDINYIDTKVAFLFIILSLFNTLRLPAQAMINVAGHFKETKKEAIIEASICIILQIVLVNIIGIYGSLLATIIALGWRCFNIIYYVNKNIIKHRSKKSLARIIKIPVVCIILLFINLLFLKCNINSYLEWVYWAIINSLISIIIILIITIVTEKKNLTEVFKQLVSVVKKCQ